MSCGRAKTPRVYVCVSNKKKIIKGSKDRFSGVMVIRSYPLSVPCRLKWMSDSIVIGTENNNHLIIEGRSEVKERSIEQQLLNGKR